MLEVVEIRVVLRVCFGVFVLCVWLAVLMKIVIMYINMCQAYLDATRICTHDTCICDIYAHTTHAHETHSY
jgi:hypothetical protein